jgi:DNA-binding NarL/FixJ family response regulator
MSRTRIMLADDHTVLLEALTNFLEPRFEIVGLASDGRSLVAKAKKDRPDVIVLDISMPDLNGIDAARMLQKEGSTSRLLFMSMHSDFPLVEEAFRVGALGYVLKVCGANELIKAIECVASGARYITPLLAGDLISTLLTVGPQRTSGDNALTLRQREVLQLLAEGKTMKQVAMRLGISTRTAESHKYEIMRQLGIQTSAELIRYAVSIKLV